jgi:hypothetical protein
MNVDHGKKRTPKTLGGGIITMLKRISSTLGAMD